MTAKIKIIIVAYVVIITCIVIESTGIFWEKRYNNNTITTGTTAELTQEDNETKEPENPNLDNSGYLSLADDPNAEDALKVNASTEGLIKKTLNYPVRTDCKKVAYLTFDDGPSSSNTPAILDVLNNYGIKATFFVVGKEINSGEDAQRFLKRTVKEGHAIGNHTYAHDYSYLYPNRIINLSNFMADIEKTNESLRNVLGKDFSTRVIRFPGGYWSWEGRTEVRPTIDEKGYAIIDWNALSGDAESSIPKNADQLVARTRQTIDDLGPNADSIVCLMHDTYGKEETVNALPRIIELFKEKGFEFKSIK
ncbi:polysaccharide deacetylase family protein [Clostridium vincentii]|uniref:Peptidoglycan-N-acetylglucosamine deacetylase n=1 Tax=Clostridium vincentii TaxID=52704 RepID=A0A2T0BH54_9CLOT|nr:polysaccharide deacetylase family protein [Clostridium vincentii]PRR83204.1 Peptidoglycan-N-acetylglucosamine deacetylase [Clostridium vincentii]